MTAYRKWLFGGIAVAVLVFLIGFFFIVTPARNNAADIHTQADQQRAQNVETAAKIEQYGKQSSEVPAKMAEIAAVQQKLPPTLQLPELIRSIESQAEKAGVTLTSITPGTPLPYGEDNPTNTSGTPIVSMPLSIDADGGYASIKSFVNGLERMKRAYFISSIDVSASGQDSTDLSVSMTGQVFSVPEGSLGLKSAEPSPSPAPGKKPAPKNSASPVATEKGQAAAKLEEAVAGAEKHRDPTLTEAQSEAEATGEGGN